MMMEEAYAVFSQTEFGELWAQLRDYLRRRRIAKHNKRWLDEIDYRRRLGTRYRWLIETIGRRDIFAVSSLGAWLDETEQVHDRIHRKCMALCDKGRHREVDSVLIQLRRLQVSIQQAQCVYDSVRQ